MRRHILPFVEHADIDHFRHGSQVSVMLQMCLMELLAQTPQCLVISMSHYCHCSMHVDGEIRSITVQVEKAKACKPFIGGYRHKVTGVEYHHAATMTMPKRRPDDGVNMCCL